MKLITIESRTFDFDSVLVWDVLSRTEYESKQPIQRGGPTHLYRPTGEPVVVIRFAGSTETFTLYPPAARAFLMYVKENVEVNTIYHEDDPLPAPIS